MDFDLTDDQRMLQDSLTRLLSDHYTPADRRRTASAPGGWSRDNWQRFAELGLLGLPFPEMYGGFDGGSVETMLVMEAFGRSLVLEPYLASVVLAGRAILRGADDAMRERLLPAIADGSQVAAFAHGERAARAEPRYVETSATPDAGSWRLNGSKALVIGGMSADLLLVTARVSGSVSSPEGLGLFALLAQASGVSRRGIRLHDGSQVADVTFTDAAADPVGVPGQAWPTIRGVLDAGIAATAAEAVGAMEEACRLTVDYLKTRQQFGKPIGTNQSLQHRSVEMLVATEQARSMALLATMMLDAPDPEARARSLARAKVVVGRNSRFVAQQAVQLHGGIGMTDEYVVGGYFRRLMVLEQAFGDPAHHLRQLADALA